MGFEFSPYKKDGYVETGIEGMPSLYYKPERFSRWGREFEKKPGFEEMIYEYFVAGHGEVYGYFSGIHSLNRIHGTTQVPAMVEIKSNRTQKEQLYIKGNIRYRVIPAKLEVTKDNSAVLEILDDLEYMYEYFEEDVDSCVKFIVNELGLSYGQFEPYMSYYSERTVKVIKDAFA